MWQVVSDGLDLGAALLATVFSFAAGGTFDRGLPQRRVGAPAGDRHGLVDRGGVRLDLPPIRRRPPVLGPYPSFADIIWAIGYAPLILGLFLGIAAWACGCARGCGSWRSRLCRAARRARRLAGGADVRRSARRELGRSVRGFFLSDRQPDAGLHRIAVVDRRLGRVDRATLAGDHHRHAAVRPVGHRVPRTQPGWGSTRSGGMASAA